MVVIQKQDGCPRRTIDLQALNSQCLRETHHTDSPFKLANLVPPNSRKTVFDATDGFNAIPLDRESRQLATFITEWGRYIDYIIFASQCKQEGKHINEVRENDDLNDEANTIGCGHIHLVEGFSTTAAADLIHEIPATITPDNCQWKTTNFFLHLP